MKLSIIVPCYNEEDTIAQALDEVATAPLPQGWSKEIIAVNDGSTDGTSAILGARAGIRAIRLPARSGKGAAVKAGLKEATGEYVVIQDADLEYDPREYAALLAPLIESRADAVFGSRNLGTNNVPISRIYFYGGLLTTHLFNLLFGTRISDIATCYKVFPRAYIPELLASKHNDFVFDCVDLTRTLIRRGRMVEVPISYRARSKRQGKKLNLVHGLTIVWAIVAARFI